MRAVLAYRVWLDIARYTVRLKEARKLTSISVYGDKFRICMGMEEEW